MKYVAIVISDCMNASLVMVNAVNSVPLSIINLNNNFSVRWRDSIRNITNIIEKNINLYFFMKDR